MPATYSFVTTVSELSDPTIDPETTRALGGSTKKIRGGSYGHAVWSDVLKLACAEGHAFFDIKTAKRNCKISDYIFEKTGVRRDSKQVASHLQTINPRKRPRRKKDIGLKSPSPRFQRPRRYAAPPLASSTSQESTSTTDDFAMLDTFGDSPYSLSLEVKMEHMSSTEDLLLLNLPYATSSSSDGTRSPTLSEHTPPPPYHTTSFEVLASPVYTEHQPKVYHSDVFTPAPTGHRTVYYAPTAPVSPTSPFEQQNATPQPPAVVTHTWPLAPHDIPYFQGFPSSPPSGHQLGEAYPLAAQVATFNNINFGPPQPIPFMYSNQF